MTVVFVNVVVVVVGSAKLKVVQFLIVGRFE